MVVSVEPDPLRNRPAPAARRKIELFVRTAAFTPKLQLWRKFRIEHRPGFDLDAERASLAPLTSKPGWPAGYQSLEAVMDWGIPDDVARGLITFNSETIDIGMPPNWESVSATRLWLQCLHFLEWAWALEQLDDRDRARESFRSFWHSWRDTHQEVSGVEWEPNVASLRVWVLCSIFRNLIEGSDLEDEVVSDIRLHAIYVGRNLEVHLGGNHFLKNIKALIGAGIFLHDDALIERGRSLLDIEIVRQVFPDGGHIERSTSYHAQVMSDLVDLLALMEAAGQPGLEQLRDVVNRMRHWLSVMTPPGNDTALFNDSHPVIPERKRALGLYQIPTPRLEVFRDSGYVVARPDDRVVLMMNVGQPGLRINPGHGHADALSFLLWIDGRPVIIDPGTYDYAFSPRRQYERSTAAHNTIEIDGASQSEVWASFRIARMARVSIDNAESDADLVRVTASHDGYRRLRGKPHHRRTWFLTTDNLRITDEVTGRGRHTLRSRLRLADAAASAITVQAGEHAATTWRGQHAPDFGALVDDTIVEVLLDATPLPTTLAWSLSW